MIGFLNWAFILALSVPCVKVRQTHNQGKRGFHHNSRDSESKAPQRQREVNFTFKSLSIFQIFQSFNILSIVILTIMADKINKKKNAENSTEVSLKTPSDFQGHQTAKNYNHLLSLMEVL